MNLVIALALGILFTLIGCYVENLSVFSYGSPLLILVYSIASFVLVSSLNIRTPTDIMIGVVSFGLVAVVFLGVRIVIYSLSGQSFVVDWLMVIFFWIIISGILMEKFLRKTA